MFSSCVALTCLLQSEKRTENKKSNISVLLFLIMTCLWFCNCGTVIRIVWFHLLLGWLSCWRSVQEVKCSWISNFAYLRMHVSVYTCVRWQLHCFLGVIMLEYDHTIIQNQGCVENIDFLILILMNWYRSQGSIFLSVSDVFSWYVKKTSIKAFLHFSHPINHKKLT